MRIYKYSMGFRTPAVDQSYSSIYYNHDLILSSALATLGSLQPRALGFLNRVDPSDSASNYYLDHGCGECFNMIGQQQAF